MRRIHVIDSHTGGEPTRIITSGGPDLGSGSLRDRLNVFRASFDDIRSAVILEPRGSDVLVGGLLCSPVDSTCCVGIIFFNNCDYLNMCGHGTIGLLVTLKHMGRISAGTHRVETPVGIVTATLHDDHRVSVTNVPSFRYRSNVTVSVEGHGPVTGDVAWGGNWFFLVADHGQELQKQNCSRLTDFCLRIRDALEREHITGADSGLIDHVELFSPADSAIADSRNFVLCPGGAYDRSPCGTGTSAKLACLAADGKLSPGQLWRQQSIVGSVFEGGYRFSAESVANASGPVIVPTITGSAWITGEADLILDPSDPFAAGIC
ncbi:MAG: proline racemase family protein [Planctomycetaceae bacterium]